MNKYFKLQTQDKILFLGFSLSLIFILLSAILVLFAYQNLPPYIPIFNQEPWGPERLGKRLAIILPIGVSMAILITNYFLANALYIKIPLLSRMFSLISIILSTLVVLLIIRTLLIVL